jgi:PhnB protein
MRTGSNATIQPALPREGHVLTGGEDEMHINIYLNFNSQCDEAFRFYEQVLGGKVTFKMTWGQMPGKEAYPPETYDLIAHATLTVGGQQLMGADSQPGGYRPPEGMNVSLHLKDKSEGERIFNALAENGNVTMPFQQTFWSPGFGMCVDRFGIPWIVNCDGVEA